MKKMNGSITYKEKQYEMVFNLNVMEKIQDEYGTIDKWGELTSQEEPNIKALVFGITEMVNEGIDIANDESEEKMPFFTTKQMGRVLSDVGFANARISMQESIINSTKGEEKNA